MAFLTIDETKCKQDGICAAECPRRIITQEDDASYPQVAEVYWRFVLNDYFAVTADAQYMQDEYDTNEDDIDGFILGIRGVVEF